MRIVAVGVLVAAATAGVSAQSNSPSPSGLQYWLPVDLAVVNTTITTETTRDVKIVKREKVDKAPENAACSSGNPGADCLVIDESSRVKRDAVLSLSTIADRAAGVHRLEIVKAKGADIGMSVDVTPGGILQSVSPSSVGRGSEIVQAIAQFGGTFLGSLLGIRNPLSLAKLPGADGLGPFIAPPPRLPAPPPPPPAPITCNPFEAPLAQQPLRVRAFAAGSAEGCDLFRRIRDKESALKSRVEDRTKTEDKLAMASPTEAPALQQRLAELRRQIKDHTSELEAMTAAFTARYDAFVAENELGTSTATGKHTCILALNEVPTNVAAAAGTAATCFKFSGVLLTGRPHLSISEAPKAPAGADKADKKEKDPPIVIAFRQSEPWIFELRSSTDATPKEKPTDKDLKVEAVQVADVIPPKTPESTLSFSPKAFGDRKLLIAFDAKGRPVKFEQSGTSSAASLANAVAQAAKTGRDEYAATLTKMVDVQKSRRELELGELTTQIEQLQKQKTLLDTRLGVASATQDFDASLQRDQLNSDLTLLQAKLAKQAAEDSYEQRLAMEGVKVQIDQLKQQVDLLAAQQELEKASKK